MNIHRVRSDKGFTLIELIIAVMIVAILASIAYPSYINQTIRANRSAVQGFMLDLANKQELYLSDNRQYALNGNDSNNYNLGVPTPGKVKDYYTVTIKNGSGGTTATVPPTYVITATPISGKRQDGDGYLTLDNTGKKNSEFTGKW